MFRRNTNYIIASFLLDNLFVILAVALTLWLRSNIPLGQPISSYRLDKMRILYYEAGILYPLIFVILSFYNPNRPLRLISEYQFLIRGSVIAGLGLAGLVYFTARDVSRLSLIYFYGIHFFSLASWRALATLYLRRFAGNGQEIRKVLLLGGGEAALRTLNRLHQLAWAGVNLVGYLTDGNLIPSLNGDIEHLGGLEEAERIINQHQVNDVLIAMPAESYSKIQQIITKLLDKPCNIWIVPDYFSLLIYGSQVEDLGGVPMISLKSPKLTASQRVIKRAFDLFIGICSLIVTLPLMAIIGIAIKLDSPGSIIFKQQRVGENGHLFWMYKFRTMVQEAEQRLTEVLQEDVNGNLVYKFANDPRVTNVGKFLRQLSLDELPQLFNVLKGEMSLVGPRPELPLWVSHYEPWQHERFAVPQGITGWWQINGRSDKPMHLNTEDDLYYVKNYSLFLDIQILCKTLGVVLRRKGAY